MPVFWACAVTPQAAQRASRPPFAITHAPGRMFVTDVPDAAHRQL
ncbi:D-glutamate cyclase family protein [Modestobacter sp. SYSU DS0875]